MKNKLLFIGLAAALASPSAFAATDTSGMRYTSAAEGFYASIRVRMESNNRHEDGGMNLENSSSRLGVRGSSDIGNGNEFFYQYEMGVGVNNGATDDKNTRVARLGLRGNFGQVQVGSFWTQSYNWVHGSTDIANVHSGNLNYTALLPGRTKQAVEYTTPDMNGFQAAAMAVINDTRKAAVGSTDVTYTAVGDIGAVTSGSTLTVRVHGSGSAAMADENDVDAMVLAAKYSAQGFTAGASYTSIPDGLGSEDHTVYAVKLGYSQDNWYANGWYSEDNSSDGTAAEDVTNMSLGGGASMGKVNIYALYETQENASGDDVYATLGGQYNFNGKSRVWVEYANRDHDSNASATDFFVVGLRHDF